MIIHHITDLHVPDAEEMPELRHVQPNILRQLGYVESNPPDLLVISGDHTIPDGSRPACEWLLSVLPRGINTIVMPGNHDDPSLLWEVFGSERCVSPGFFFAAQYGEWNILFMNTATDQLPPEQIEFLAAQPGHVPTILFMHHPPDLVTDGFMARSQPLLNHEEASEAIRSSPVSHVFCGHYHNTAEKDCDGFTLYLTSSPAFQIDLHSEEFRMEAFEPTVRTIELAGAEVRTRVVEV